MVGNSAAYGSAKKAIIAKLKNYQHQ